MDKRDVNYYHGQLIEYGLWFRGGKDAAGVKSSWPDCGKPPETASQPRSATNRRKSQGFEGCPSQVLIEPHQPSGTRKKPESRVLIYPIDRRSQEIHQIVMRLDRPVIEVVQCMYHRGMDFIGTCRRTGLTSSDVGKCRYKAIKAIAGEYP